MKPPYILFLACFLPLFGAKDTSLPPRTGKDYAVFFYVTDYDDRRWPSLPETKTECEKIADELDTQYGFDCQFVRNPTKEQIREKIRAFNDRDYAPGDQVLFFFSMHGHYDADLDRGFLVARDGKIGDRYGDSWYSYDDLSTDLSRSRCRHVLLALDACHSGAFGIPNEKGGPGGPDYNEEPDCAKKISGLLQYKTRLYLCSGSKDTKTPGQSLFAARWLDALRTGDDGGVLSTNDLQFHLGKILKPKYDWGKFKGHDGGDFVFVRKNACGAVSDDRDGDGIPNALDKCPDQYGVADKNGCPYTSTTGNDTAPDSDLDGVSNATDACPNEYGTAKANGCPDADDDGVPDKSDKCKYAAGLARWEGCPDTDGDGLPDNTDQCPTQKGAATDNGCPFADGFVLVQAGTFTMGSPTTEADRSKNESQHYVALSDFYISPYEVTQKQWKQVMGTNPSTASKNCDECPVENVSWFDIQDFLKKINAYNPAHPYRLPTEAEWEYAARGGDQSKGYLYSGGDDVGTVAGYSNNSGGKTQPVGERKFNELGLYDMSGNVWEWCSDWWDENYYNNSPAKNPAGPDFGVCRVLRGGGWSSSPQKCRAAYRDYYAPTLRYSNLGFRLARSF